MVSTVDICNLALDELGEEAITALDEGTTVANLCNRNIGAARDELLRAHPWNFAIRRRKMARLAAAPDFGFAYAFQKPVDWLRTIGVHGDSGGFSNPEYRMEGEEVLADSPNLYLRYVARIDDPNIYDVLFVEALALKLAARLSKPITQSSSEKERVEALARDVVRQARAVDAVEDFPDQPPLGSWLTARQREGGT